MTLQQIRRLAQALGIEEPERLSTLALIRLIKIEEGQMPCFSEAWSIPCKIDDCPFFNACSSHLRLSDAVNSE